MFTRAFCGILLGIGAACAADLRVSGPFTHDNLTVFLLSEPGARGARLMTLQEAMEQKKVVVYETGSVNELTIENKSAEDVFIQAGDIVKGGRQDRVIPTDYVLTSHSGKVPISSFCVEHGRWTQRGNESSAQFETSNNMVAFKGLKQAVHEKNAQQKVWNQVSTAQTILVESADVSASRVSPSSMQLTLENKRLVDSTDAYVKALSKIVAGKSDTVGFAYAINGKLAGGDVYGSAELFAKMWPKLLRTSATEAVAERSRAQGTVSADEVTRALALADKARVSKEETAGKLAFEQKDSADAVVYETRDKGTGGSLHRSYVIK